MADPPSASFQLSIPVTWVTDCSRDIGNTFGPNGLAIGSRRQVSSSKYPKSYCTKVASQRCRRPARCRRSGGEDLAEVDPLAIDADAAAGGDQHLAIVQRIGEFGQSEIRARGEGEQTSAGRFMARASWGRSALNWSTKASKWACCCRLFIAGKVSGQAPESFFKPQASYALSQSGIAVNPGSVPCAVARARWRCH